jgi:fibronectin-binding autotransporter adhesin
MKQWLGSAMLLGIAVRLSAATLQWDADPATPGRQDGAGTWDAVNTNWWDGTTHTNWTDVPPDAAIIGAFTGPGGAISLAGSRAADALTINAPVSGGYTLTNGDLTVGAGGITLGAYVTTNLALDDLSVPAAGAWSLRKLTAAYTGPAVQVRRPSDNALQDVGFDGTGFLDTNALLTFVGSETGTVARWYDQSGNGRDGVQTNNANQPQLFNPNGKWAVLGRNNQWLTATNCTVVQMTTGGSNGTAMLVYRAQNVQQATFGWYDGGTRWSAHVNWNDANLYFDPGTVAGSRVQVGNGGNNGVWQQYALVRSNNNAAIRWGGVTRASSGNRTGNLTLTGTTWGVLSAAGATPYANGDMVEYIQFANGLSAANLQRLELSQGTAFGVAISGVSEPLWSAGIGSALALAGSQSWLSSNGAGLAVSGPVSGTGDLTKSGPGSLLLQGDSPNTFVGTTVLQEGLLGLSKPAGVAAIPGDFTGDNGSSPRVYTTANAQFAPGAVLRFTGTTGEHARLEMLGTTQTFAGVDNTLAAGRGVIQQREVVTVGNVGGASRLVLDGAGDYRFNAYLRDTGGQLALTKAGSGTQTLAGANLTLTGGALVQDGWLRLDGANNWGSSISNLAVVEFYATNAANWSLANGRVLAGSGTFLKTGPGRASINGANVQASGQILVQEGRLSVDNNSSVWTGCTADLDISAAGIFDMRADGAQVDALTGAGVVSNSYGNGVGVAELLILGVANGSGLFTGYIGDGPGSGSGEGNGLIAVTKVGSGTQTLAGVNTYRGATTVAGGVLALGATGSISNSTLIQVNSGAVLDVTAAGVIQLNTNQTLRGGGLVQGAVIAQPTSRLVPGTGGVGGTLETLSIAGHVALHAESTNSFNLGASTNAGGGFNDLVAIAGDLEPSNSVVQIILNAPPANGTYRLFTYTGTKLSSFNPIVDMATGLGRKSAVLDESVGGQVNLTVAGGFGDLVWLPQTSAVWNATEANWSNTATALLDVYTNFDAVTFNEAGAYSNVVTLAAALTPSEVLVDGASNYTFAGAAIAGAAGLTKTGAGTLTILNTNTYTGPTTISDGVLHLGDGGNFNGLSGTAYINVTNTGTLSLYSPGNLVLAQAVRGNGTWLNRGPGVSGVGEVDPTNNNAGFAGSLVLTNLRFRFSTAADVGGATITVQDRGQIWLMSGLNTRPITMTGLGWQEPSGQLGAIRLANSTNAGPITLVGPSRISTHSGGERGEVSGNISGPHQLELWNGNGGFTFLTGTNTFQDLRLTGGWQFYGNSSALGVGNVYFNNGGLSAYLAPLLVTNPVATLVVPMHVGQFEGYLPVTFANTITISNTHVDANIYNTTTVIGAFSGGTKGIYKYAPGELRLMGTNTLGWLFNSGGAGVLSLVSNSVSTVSGNMGGNGGGVIRITDNAQATFAGGLFLGESNGGGGAHVVQDSGSLTFGTAGLNFRIGHFPNNVSTYTMNGGTLNATATVISVGWDGTGRLIITNGTVNALGIQLDSNGNSTLPDLLSLSGSGVLSLGGSGLFGPAAGGPQTVLFGGGKVTARGDWTAFNNQNITLTNTSGATTWDTAGYTITADCVLNGVGGLNKAGAGRLVLHGLNTFSGPTIVSNGELVVNRQLGAGTVVVEAAATLRGTGTVAALTAAGLVQPGSLTAAGPLTASSLSLADGAQLNVFVGDTSALVRVTATDGLTVPVGPGTTVVNILNGSLTVGSYTVIDYEGTIQGGDATNFVLGIYKPHAVMYLTNNAANTSLDLVVVSTEAIKWTGLVNANWNIDTTTNWVTSVGGLPTAYLQPGALGDALVFDDTASGNFTVALQSNVSPASLVASNDVNDYVVTGGFGIGGPLQMQKYGAATFTLATSNTLSGGAAIYGGTLQLGDGTNVGTLGTGPVTNDGVLAINQSQTNVFPNLVRGAGSLHKRGPGRVTLGVVSPYTGGTVVDGGELALIFANAGVGAMTINEGGTLRATVLDAINAFTNTTINRGGLLLHSGGTYQQFAAGPLVMNGGVLESTVAVAQLSNYGNFRLNTSMTVGGTNMSIVRGDFRMGDNANRLVTVGETGEDIDLFFQGYVSHFHGVTWGYMTKAGPGTVAFSNYTYTVQLGSLTVSAGEARFINALGLGSLGNGGLINNALTRIELTTGMTQTCNVVINGSGVLVKSGPGLLIVTGTVAGTQSVVVDGGVMTYLGAARSRWSPPHVGRHRRGGRRGDPGRHHRPRRGDRHADHLEPGHRRRDRGVPDGAGRDQRPDRLRPAGGRRRAHVAGHAGGGGDQWLRAGQRRPVRDPDQQRAGRPALRHVHDGERAGAGFGPGLGSAVHGDGIGQPGGDGHGVGRTERVRAVGTEHPESRGARRAGRSGRGRVREPAGVQSGHRRDEQRG